MTTLFKNLRFLKNTPKASLRMAKGSILAKLGKNTIRNCQLALTFACNHDCDMCSSNLLIQEKPALTMEQWFKVADELKSLGCTHFDLTGGEPTLKGLDFLTELISYINKDNNCIVSMATNCKLIDEDWLKALKKAGMNAIEFNIQSLDAATHDKIVNDEGNLKHIQEMIPVATKEGINVCINTCLGTYNFEEIEKIVKWGKEKDLITCLNLAAPTGKLTGKDFVRLTEFEEKYYALLNKYPIARSDTSFNYRGSNLCPGGIEKVYITAYGEVMQCTFCQISFGNVLEEPLKEIYKRFLSHPLIKERSICKHSFNINFRDKWINPIKDNKKVPLPLKEHPNYNLFFKKD